CWSQSVIFHRSRQKPSIISNSPSLPRWHDSNKRVSEKPGAVHIQKSADDKKPQAKSNADIESSGLPDQTQKTLKMIRELKRQIEEKQQELQALMADQNMDPEIKKSKIGALVTKIATLSAGLATANNALVKQARENKISPDQLQQAQQLAAK
ncbi:hypothetical protein, partial [Pseudomonas amygdali]|uniref:hypothetical protein n=2 Tax=Pseudomonas amygdali TaxID=47877 RepID=UPI001FB81F84